jgi:hypothetical protein
MLFYILLGQPKLKIQLLFYNALLHQFYRVFWTAIFDFLSYEIFQKGRILREVFQGLFLTPVAH